MRAETRGKIGEAYAEPRCGRAIARALYRSTVLPQAEATVASALSAYRVGGVDFMTLLDDRMTVNKYRQELYALDADEGKAWAELEMLIGRELIRFESDRRDRRVRVRTRGLTNETPASFAWRRPIRPCSSPRSAACTSRRATAAPPPPRPPGTNTARPPARPISEAAVMLTPADARRIGVTFAAATLGALRARCAPSDRSRSTRRA